MATETAPGPVKVVLASDFNIQNLAGYLNNTDGTPGIEAKVIAFGQVMPVLLDPQHEVWNDPYDAVVVWTRLEGVSQLFADTLQQLLPSKTALLEEVDRFAELLIELKDRARTIFVPSWVLPASHRGLGFIDMKEGGHHRILLEANLRLARQLEGHSGIFILNTQRWVEQAGQQAHNPKFWYMGKIAFGGEVFRGATVDIQAALSSLRGDTRKLIVLDLDNTLWGGIIGDDGMDGIKLGGHDPVGEAFVDFQKALKALQRRGVVLGVVSKNEASVALEAIEGHPEMQLRKDDFVGWRINWKDKAKNVQELAQELNLGLQSVVFIDDNPAERARVSEALPEVLVPEWPVDKMLYTQALHALTCFDGASIGDEDRKRTEMYTTERKRNEGRQDAQSLEQWLTTLELSVTVEPFASQNVLRITQLLNKTNQMNLITRRPGESELLDWIKPDGRALWSIRVKDRFGDSGLTGIVSVDCSGNEATLVDFVLSCRVFGRQVERLMMRIAVDYAREQGRAALVAKCLPNEKNKPTMNFLKSSGLECIDDTTFQWDTVNTYEIPDFIEVSVQKTS